MCQPSLSSQAVAQATVRRSVSFGEEARPINTDEQRPADSGMHRWALRGQSPLREPLNNIVRQYRDAPHRHGLRKLLFEGKGRRGEAGLAPGYLPGRAAEPPVCFILLLAETDRAKPRITIIPVLSLSLSHHIPYCDTAQRSSGQRAEVELPDGTRHGIPLNRDPLHANMGPAGRRQTQGAKGKATQEPSAPDLVGLLHWTE